MKTEAATVDTKKAAQKYLAAGYSVLPAIKVTKVPLLTSWAALQHTPMTPEAVAQCFRKEAQIGVIGGAVSGNLEILDFDDPDVYEPFLEMLELRAPGLAERLVKHTTPSGGYHLIYRSSEPVAGNQVFASLLRSEKTLTGKGVRIETRGEGGYALVPPSEGYKVLSGSLLSCPVLTTAEVGLLHTTARIFDLRESEEPIVAQQVQGRDNSEAPGTRYNAEHNMRDILASYGWRPAGRTTAGEGWTRPGKDSGVSGVLLSSTGNFYVWTSSVSELEPNKSYNSFAMYTAYEHSGDYSKAAKELYRQENSARLAVNMSEEQDKAAVEHQDHRLRFLSIAEVLANIRPPDWIIKSYLDRNSLAALFGASGTMKSFAAIDIGLSVATGEDWHGHGVQPSASVFYLCGEGFSGIGRRIKAWGEAHKVDVQAAPFFVSNQAAQMLDPLSVEEVSKAVEALKSEHGTPALIIIDTLNRNFGPGDENSTNDMTGFIAALDRLRIRSNCTLLLIHHTGLMAPERARGSSALRAALDWEFKLIANDDGIRTLTCTKSKDHEPPPALSFEPETIFLDDMIDEDGVIASSCVLRLVDGQAASSVRKPLSGAKKVAYNALLEAIKENGEEMPEEMVESMRGDIDGFGIVHLDTWREVAYRANISTSEDSSSKRKAFTRAVSGLRDSGHVEVQNDYAWPVAGQRDRTGTNTGHVPAHKGQASGTDRDIYL